MDFAIASTPCAAVESPFDGIIGPLHPGSSTLSASRCAINPEILPGCPEMAAFGPTVIRKAGRTTVALASHRCWPSPAKAAVANSRRWHAKIACKLAVTHAGRYTEPI